MIAACLDLIQKCYDFICKGNGLLPYFQLFKIELF